MGFKRIGKLSKGCVLGCDQVLDFKGGLKLQGYLIHDGYADLVQHASDWVTTAGVFHLGFHQHKMVINSPCLTEKKELAIPGQTATSKELSNALMASSLPKTTLPTQLTTLKIKTVNDDVRLQALIDGKKVVITEAFIRHDLKLKDAEGTSCLPNAVSFEELARMGAREQGGEVRSLTKELKSFNSKVESLDFKETVLDKKISSKQGRKIAYIDTDAEVNLENVYNLDLALEETVLSMQYVTNDDGKEVAKEKVEVITTTKIIVDEVSTASGELNAANKEPVSAAPTNITATKSSEATKTTIDIPTTPKAKGIVFHDMKESTTRAASLKEGPEMNEKSIKASRKRTRKENVEKDQTAKKQKVPDNEDDVFVNVAPLSSKPPRTVDYKIYKEGKKEHFQIIRENGNHQMYLAFSTMLKNFDIVDLEVLWKIVKDRFKETQPKEVLCVFLWHTLKVMFEHSVEDSGWKLQKGPKGLAMVKNWKLFDSCGVHCVTLDNIQLYLIAEKMYPLTNCTLQ
nr:hypothetical protein [Tanacetum cinerariifolium]